MYRIFFIVVADGNERPLYMFSSVGLYPAPLSRTAKSSLVNKIKNKFKLLGKVMAKSIMDSRMVSKLKIFFLVLKVVIIFSLSIGSFNLIATVFVLFYNLISPPYSICFIL